MSNLSELLPTGGGQNAVEFVASGTLASGQTVVLKTDGTVEAIAAVSQSASVGSATQISSNITQDPSLVYDASSGKVVFTYIDSQNNNYATAAVGTISGTSISFGTPVVIYSTAVGSLNTAYDSANEKIIVVYRNGANSYGYAHVGTVSGTSISFGSDYNFTTAATSASGYGLAYDTANSKFVVTYSDSGNSDRGTAKVGTVSGTAISYGSATVYQTGGSSWPDLTYDSANGKVVAVVTDNSTTNIKAYVGTVSGTSITFGSGVIVNSGQTGEFNAIGYDVQSGKVIVAYEDRSNGYYGTAKVGTVSGTSISFGTAVVFRTVNTGNAYFLVGYDAGVGRTNIFFRIYDPSDQGLVATGTVSGTSITFDSNFTVSSSNRYVGAAYDSVNKKWGYYVRPGANDLDGVVFTTAGTSTNLTATNFIGITAEAISNAATGKVNVYGGINEAQSGLTIASDYYVQANGTLNTATSVVNYDIANASYTQAFSVSSQDTQPSAIAFNPAGTKMFIAGNQGNDIGEYTLSTAFDVSTASFVDSFSVNSQETAPMGVAFNTDGTRMFVNGEAANTVFQYALSTGFDVSTASYTQGFSTAAQDSASNGIAFNTDGTKMFVTAESTKKINEYTLSSAFDVSTASFVDGFLVSSQADQPKDTQFNSDGTEMYLVSRSPATAVYKYTLTTGFDVSTASYANVSFSIANEETSPQGLAFSADGSKMYVCGFTGADVNEYATSTTVTNSTTVKAGQAISATTINMKDLT